MSASGGVRRAAAAVRRRVRPLRRLAKQLARRPLHVHIENRWRLGDEILAIPFYQLVHEHYPDASLTVAVNYPELLCGNPHVQVRTDVGEFACDRYLFAKDDARDVPRLQHLCRLHHIPYRAVEPEVVAPPACALPEPLPRAALRIACSCGAGWACKSLPAAFLRALCAGISRQPPSVGFVEVGQGCPVAGVGVCYVDRLSVAATAHVLASCNLYIGPDSGLAHLAMAVGTPALVCYGPVTPHRAFGPRRLLHPVLSPAACQGCWTDGRMQAPGTCPLGTGSPAPEDYACMRAFDIESVLRRLLASGLAARTGRGEEAR